MSTIATLVVQLVGDVGDYSKSIDKAESHTRSVLGNLGSVVAGFGAATVGVFAAVGTAAFSSAMKMDEAYDTIRTGTGATGDALEGLKDDFQAIFTSVPTDAQSAADAVAALNSRLGVTGANLQNLATPLLEMTRLLGGDAKTNAELFSRVVGDWGLPLEDASASLDEIFVASQRTGVGVEQLMRQVVQFGSPMRLMGFSIHEAIGLFAKWEAEGVNAELVMGSLRIAAGKFAKENIPLQKGLADTINKIQNMTDSSAALALGMEIFGARAGPDMVAAIREGRFALGDLTEALMNADGAILETAADTEDFPEKFQKMRNRIEVALAPLGMKIMDAIGGALDWLGPRIEALAPIFEQAFEQIGGAIETVITVLKTVADWVQTNWPAIQNTIVGVFERARAIIEPILQAIWSVVQAIFGNIQTFFATHGEEIKATLGIAWQTIQSIVQGVVMFFQEVVIPTIQSIALFISEHALEIQTVLGGAWTAIQSAIQGVLNFINGIVQSVLSLFRGDWDGFWNSIRTTFETLWNDIKKFFDGIFNAAGGILAIIHDALGPLLAWLQENVFGPVQAAWDGFWGGIRSAAEGVINAIRSAWESLVSFVDGLRPRLEGPTSPHGGPFGGRSPNAPPLPGGQHGLHMTVPAGFPNDSFLFRASSGEQVDVTPRGQSSGGGMQFLFAAGSIIVYGATDPAATARAVMDEAARRGDAQLRLAGV